MRHPHPHHRSSRQQRCSLVRPTEPSACSSRQPTWAEPIAHLLLPGEVAKMQADAYGWRWEPADVTYDRRHLLLGGPIGMAITGFASVMANRRARRRAEREAAPAWRPLGPLSVIATDLRLFVWHLGDWHSVWYLSIARTGLDAAESSVEIDFFDASPYRLDSDEAGCLFEQVRASRCSGTR
jgi:hypothetical protein